MKKNFTVAILAAAALSAFSLFAHAADDDEETGAHFYVGTSTGYYKLSKDRGDLGNSRTLGAVLGRQFNDDWSAEFNYYVDAFSPGNYDINARQINIIRHWGTDTRFLVEFGIDDFKVGGMSGDFGYHVGAGLSAFLTQNLELRGDLKVIYYGADQFSQIISARNDQSHLDGMGQVSLNWHFGRTGSSYSRSSNKTVLGASSPREQETLPPIQQREPIEPEELVVEEEAIIIEQPMAEPMTPAAPRSSHVLVNFGSNSLDVGAQYGQQLDEISSEIISTNSKAVIEGNTDTQGSAAYNKTLSMDRAITVKRELKKRGVKSEDLSVVGYGEDHPITTNDTAEGREQNRRVEVKVYDKE